MSMPLTRSGLEYWLARSGGYLTTSSGSMEYAIVIIWGQMKENNRKKEKEMGGLDVIGQECSRSKI